MKRLLAVLSLLGSGCGISLKACPDEIDSIVLEKLYRQFNGGINGLEVWLSPGRDWAKELTAQQAEIDRIRKWAKTVKDPCVKDAYFGWLNYFEGELKDAWNEFRNRPLKKEMDAYDQKNKEQEKRESAYREKHGSIPVPPPR